MKIIVLASLVFGILAAGEPDWSMKDLSKQGILFSAFSTDKSFWSKEGGFGLNWGMGPADVKSKYPNMQMTFSDSSAPEQYQQSYFTDQVEGLPVGVLANFCRGRLFRISIKTFPNSGDIIKLDSKDYLTTMKQQKKQNTIWQKAIFSILLKRYGEPICSPDPEAVELTKPESYKPIVGYNFNYVWIVNKTQIMLNIANYSLEYFQREAFDLYQTAVKQQKETFQKEQLIKQQKDRERL